MIFYSEIILNLCRFLEIEDIINFQLVNQRIYYSHVYKSLIWNSHNKTDLDNEIFIDNTKQLYNKFKNNLCHLCKNKCINHEKILKMLCFNCTYVFNDTSSVIVVHRSCFLKNNGKLNKFANIFNCRCLYCKSLVMVWSN